MIITEAEHWFQAKCPILEEHEEDQWFRHPHYSLQCNKLGIIVFDDDIDFTYVREKNTWRVKFIRNGKTLFDNIGNAYKIMWECWTGITQKYCHFFFLDGNPMNICYENLQPSYMLTKHELDNAKKMSIKFVENSVKYMCSRKEILEKKGIKPDDYFEIMNLPPWLMKEWKKVDCDYKKPIKVRKLPEGPYKQNERSIERTRVIKELMEQGYNQKQISDMLGFRNKSLVSYYANKISYRDDI
jgi:hypothetical protein